MYMIWCFWLFEGECLNFNHWWPNKFSYCIYSLIFTPWQYTLLVLYLYVYFLSHRFKHFHSCQTVITKKRTELSIWISVSDRYLAGQHNMYNCTLSLSLSLSLSVSPPLPPSLSLHSVWTDIELQHWTKQDHWTCECLGRLAHSRLGSRCCCSWTIRSPRVLGWTAQQCTSSRL